MRALLLALCYMMGFALTASAQSLIIQESIVVDYRSVVARIEASDTATARSRLQGVVTRLSIDEGDQVKAGEVVAVVVDSTLEPQLAALRSRADGLKSQIRQAEEDLARNEKLLANGFYPKARLDEQRTALDVSRRTLAAAEAERRALVARQGEGSIRAPADSRVTSVEVVNGAIVSPGEVLARFATLTDIVRLSLPERHASEISEGGTVALRLPARDGSVRTATIIKIYPELRNGALIADATVQGGLDGLVGERVDVLVSVGERRAIRVPDKYVSTRFGVDFVRVKVGDRFVEAPVAIAGPSQGGEIEILSGLRIGDVIEPRETTT
ncbi:efflux RND transporter periplasmic adaptor subunit [Hyphomonas chukchiensis]|nr:efflux RND transporter periplasmic adaptor subunit [Hyphomonas chukchiensis]